MLWVMARTELWLMAPELRCSHRAHLQEELNKQLELRVAICSKTNQHPFYSTISSLHWLISMFYNPKVRLDMSMVYN